jgi:pSer/pThr/pTyr-binding forkhead associated (FHA) protein
MKTCGREPSSDLVLDQVTVSRLHARIELADDGLVLIEDAGSENGTFLNRNDTWIQIKRVTLCIGDRIRFGDCEVPLERITAVFHNRSDVRLEARHFPLRHSHIAADLRSGLKDSASDLQKPRRNPSTGKIEDKQPV